MKTLMTVILLLNVLGLSFGRGSVPDFIYWAMMPLTFVLIVIYWFVSFWVSRKEVESVLGHEPCFDVFAGKVSSNPSDDLLRGRLCVDNGMLVLFVRNTGRHRRKNPCAVQWSTDISKITSLGFGKLENLQRKGFYVYCGDNYTMFTCSSIEKKKDMFYKALGWNK